MKEAIEQTLTLTPLYMASNHVQLCLPLTQLTTAQNLPKLAKNILFPQSTEATKAKPVKHRPKGPSGPSDLAGAAYLINPASPHLGARDSGDLTTTSCHFPLIIHCELTHLHRHTATLTIPCLSE